MSRQKVVCMERFSQLPDIKVVCFTLSTVKVKSQQQGLKFRQKRLFGFIQEVQDLLGCPAEEPISSQWKSGLR